MSYREFQKNVRTFAELINQVPAIQDEHLKMMINNYIEQNTALVNEMLTISIDNLQKLQKAKSAGDIVSIQAKFTNDIGKNVSYSTQRFLNASLGQIAGYNQWLKERCDIATN